MFKNIVDFVEEIIFMIGYNFLITLLLLLLKSFAVIAILIVTECIDFNIAVNTRSTFSLLFCTFDTVG